MPGPIVHLGATYTCSHGGQATPAVPFPRVLVSGQPVVAQTSPWVIAGCGFVPPGGNGPCVTATVLSASLRVLVGGAPAVLLDSVTTCAPTATPMIPIQTQVRVVAQ